MLFTWQSLFLRYFEKNVGVTNQATSKEKDFWQDLCREAIILGLKCLANNMPP